MRYTRSASAKWVRTLLTRSEADAQHGRVFLLRSNILSSIDRTDNAQFGGGSLSCAERKNARPASEGTIMHRASPRGRTGRPPARPGA
eukprot:5000431-Prymnesium_polylepis.1